MRDHKRSDSVCRKKQPRSPQEEDGDAEEEKAGGTFWHRDRILSLLDTYRSYRKEMIKERRKKLDIWKDVILHESSCILFFNIFY